MKNISLQPLTEHREPRTAQRGVAMAMALYILVVFVILGLVLCVFMANQSQVAIQNIASMQALFIAEAGLQDALYDLKSYEDWSNVSSYSKDLNVNSDITGSFIVTYSYDSTPVPPEMVITSTGISTMKSRLGSDVDARRVVKLKVYGKR